jgi:hypothetical protein
VSSSLSDFRTFDAKGARVPAPLLTGSKPSLRLRSTMMSRWRPAPARPNATSRPSLS